MGLGTVFVIGVTTARMIMPGMPAIPQIPGMKAVDLNAPTKTLTMNLSSDKKVNKESKAECAVPEGLKLGPKVDLHIDLPVASTGPAISSDGPGDIENAKFVMKMYWNCAETVPAGQPKVIDSEQLTSGKGMSAKEMEKMRKGLQKAIEDSGISHAYWPGPDAKQIQKDSCTPGFYKLTTNYCGGTSITFDPEQDFLAPIDLVSPKGGVDLEKTIKIEWKSVQNAQAYLVTAFAGNDKQMVMWTSSSDPETHADLQGRALTKKQLETLLQNGVLLPPTKTNCRIPAGIFKDVGTPTFMVTAFGTDKIQSKDGIETHVVVRSNATAMLGGPDMGDMGAVDQAEADDEQKSDTKHKVKSSSDEEPAEDEQASSGDDGDNEMVEAAKEEASEQTKETIRDSVRKVFGKLRRK